MRTTALLVLLVGCVDQPARDPSPPDPGAWQLPAPLVITAEDPTQLAAWRAEVVFNVDELTFAVRAYNQACPAPFVIADRGHEVLLASTECDGLEPGMAGGQDRDGGIVVRGNPADNHFRSELRGTIMHTLGHAVGLDHADPYEGTSAMTVPPGTQLFARDAEAIARQLGCL